MSVGGGGLRLVTLNAHHRQAVMTLLRSYRAAGETRYEKVLTLMEVDFRAYLAWEADLAAGRNLRPGYVPESIFWLVDPDGRFLGSSRLRHHLSPSLCRFGGHIGYDIGPTARGNGYGTTLLRLTLARARDRGLDRVLLTCDSDNIPSRRVIERNGGVLAEEQLFAQTGRLGRRYWIEL